MDIEWAKDADDGGLYIVQARPETVASRRSADFFENYTLTGRAPVLVRGKAVGEKIGTGVVRVIASAADLHFFQPGEVLVASSTSPDWEPVMKTAGAIITDRGGRTCHAAIVARELGVPAVVGTDSATRTLTTGTSCADGESGVVYSGSVPFAVKRIPMSTLELPKTEIMVNLGNPDLAFKTAMMPNAGVGLARMEFIISEHIGVHPMALMHAGKVATAYQARIVALSRAFASPRDFFVRTLAEGVGTIAAAFYPRPVIIRLSDFKTNEYASLIGGSAFEPVEANPMLGFRGAARYALIRPMPTASRSNARPCAGFVMTWV
jgi:pyruvate,water dikinase